MIRIHFMDLNPAKKVIPLAAALGAGPNMDDFAGNRYEDLFREAKNHFESVTLQAAEIVVYPHGYPADEVVTSLEERARAASLPLVLFKQSDDSTSIDLTYATVFRDSLFKSRQSPCEVVMPAFCDDPTVAEPGRFPILDKPASPTVGFCGYVGQSRAMMIFLAIGQVQKVIGLAFRRLLLSHLSDSKKVRSDFVIRTSYWGGAMRLWRRRVNILLNRVVPGKPFQTEVARDASVADQVYHEFLDNLSRNAYTVCVRGAGNFSYRFYEVLSAGRIPLFIDTDCPLPFESDIDYDRHLFKVSWRDRRRIASRLADFHASISEEEFRAMQVRNRQLWRDWFTPLSFYTKALRQTIDQHSQALADLKMQPGD